MSDNDTPYIFLDTCSLLASCWNGDDRHGEKVEYSAEKEARFWNVEFPNLLKMGTVILPNRNYEELKKHSNSTKKPWLAENSKYILEKLAPYIADKRVQIVGDPNDPFADAILLSVALKFRTQRNMAFITQDRKLAEDLWAIQNFRSVEPRNGVAIKIRRIAPNGAIEKHRGLSDEQEKTRERASSTKPKQAIRAGRKQADKAESDKEQQRSTKSWWEE